MENQIQTLEPTDIVFNSENTIVTTSLKVAEYFKKRHDNVLSSIQKLHCSKKFKLLNFKVCYKNNDLQNGKKQKFYEITKDGFMFLAMSFSGKKAGLLKEAFIDAFNYMYEQLNERTKTGMQLMNEIVKREIISKAKGTFGSKLMNERKKEKHRIQAEVERIESEYIPKLFEI